MITKSYKLTEISKLQKNSTKFQKYFKKNDPILTIRSGFCATFVNDILASSDKV